MFLLDTNVLSELRRKLPNAGVVEWFSKRPPTTLHISVLTWVRFARASIV